MPSRGRRRALAGALAAAACTHTYARTYPGGAWWPADVAEEKRVGLELRSGGALEARPEGRGSTLVWRGPQNELVAEPSASSAGSASGWPWAMTRRATSASIARPQPQKGVLLGGLAGVAGALIGLIVGASSGSIERYERPAPDERSTERF